jgi:hypothetical protein
VDANELLQGVEYLAIQGLADKRVRLTVKTDTLYIENGVRKVAHNSNDPLSIVSLYKKIRAFSPPSQKHIYCHAATERVLKRYKKINMLEWKTDPYKHCSLWCVSQVCTICCAILFNCL